MVSVVRGVRAVDHVGLSVPDLDEASGFFVSVLGAEELFRHGPYGPSGEHSVHQFARHPDSVVDGIATTWRSTLMTSTPLWSDCGRVASRCWASPCFSLVLNRVRMPVSSSFELRGVCSSNWCRTPTGSATRVRPNADSLILGPSSWVEATVVGPNV